LKSQRILIVSEKYKQALAIAKALGKVKRETLNNVPILFVNANNSNIVIVPLRGHITEYTTKPEYEKWSKTDPKLILLDKNALERVYKEIKYIKALKTLAKQCDELIFATDADEEGENIALEAWEIIRQVNPNLKPKRLWLHTLVPRDIREAFKNLIEPKWTWAYAVEARRQIDALIGFAATRELTLALKPFLKQIGTNIISVGRVQTPTLYLIYDRERKIKNFIPELYWNLLAEINIHGEIIKAKHVKSPSKDKNTIFTIYNKIRGEKFATLKDIKRNEIYIQPPTPFNTTEALKTITKILPITAKTAMRILEDLYLDALISYPRTDTDKYSPSFPHRETIAKFLKSRIYRMYAEEIMERGVFKPRQGRVFKGDHDPITPIDVAEPNDRRFRTQNHWKVYDIVVRRYLALFMPPAKELGIKLLFLINEEQFKAEITTLLEEGFMKVWPWMKKEYTLIPKLPRLGVTQIYPIKKIYTEEKKTKPPPRLTESNLIAMMQKFNLGTKSTRPQHIETNKKRGYIIKKGRSIFCSDLGWTLASNLEKIWPEFVLPKFTAKIEEMLQKIMDGSTDWINVVENIRKEFLDMFDKLRERKPKIVGEIEKIVDKMMQEGITSETYAKCLKCGGSMILRKGKTGKRYIKCTNCGETRPLPQRGSIRILKTKICPICGNNVLSISIRNFSYKLCPVCWISTGICAKCTYNACNINKKQK